MPKETHAFTAVASVVTDAFGGADAGSNDDEIILSLFHGVFVPVAIAIAIAVYLQTYIPTVAVAQSPPPTTLFEE